jgi:hypothetical protein
VTLQELFERAMVNSGQFQFTPEQIELNEEAFLVIVKLVVGKYNSYCPHVEHLYVNTASNQWTFIAEQSQIGSIPSHIVSMTPIRPTGSELFRYFGGETQQRSLSWMVKQEYPFEYRPPVMSFPGPGEYDVLAAYDHIVTLIPGETDRYEIKTIDDGDNSFIDMITGYFLVSLGRSRRAFTIADLPISPDASDLVSEGKELIDAADEDMKENEGLWYLGWGG